MDFSWFVEQGSSGTILYVTLKAAIEMQASGTTVHTMMGLRDARNNGQWDWLECTVDYDGAANANANSRSWSVNDRYSTDIPYTVGLEGTNLDSQQDWVLIDSLEWNYTECPSFAKCIFHCTASRFYETDDATEDYNYFNGPTSINFWYGVYYSTDLMLQGGSTYDNFRPPLTSNATFMTASLAAATLAISFIAF